MICDAPVIFKNKQNLMATEQTGHTLQTGNHFELSAFSSNQSGSCLHLSVIIYPQTFVHGTYKMIPFKATL